MVHFNAHTVLLGCAPSAGDLNMLQTKNVHKISILIGHWSKLRGRAGEDAAVAGPWLNWIQVASTLLASAELNSGKSASLG